MEHRPEDEPVPTTAEPAAAEPQEAVETDAGGEPPEAGDSAEDSPAAAAETAPAEEAPPAAAAETAPAEEAPPAAAVTSPPGAPAGEDAPGEREQGARELVIPKKGKRVSGKIIQIGDSGVFVDFGGREEGVLDLAQIRDRDGKLKKAVGDSITATVVSVEGGVKLKLKSRGRAGNLPALLEAHKSGLPVEGKVTGVNKGGLVVHVMGVRAFCPFSQIDRRYIDNPQDYVGKKLKFRISGADEKGRNVVLSRRSLLEDEAQEKAEAVRKELEVGQELSGVVARIRPFGAFVDLGGVDGMVHVSEMSHSRIQDPSEVLEIGQEVRVRVVKIANLGTKKERISLSIKQLQADPWEAAVGKLSVGDRVTGKVVRVVDFGAFLEIAPGVDGLAHVSTLATKRVEHPSDVVKSGETVEAWVVQIDHANRRLSLSLVEPSRLVPHSGDRGSPRRERREAKSPRPGPQRQATGLTSMAEAFQRMRKRQSDP